MKTIRIGCGASFATDRIDPAVELADKGKLDYLVFECLAERTIAQAQLRKLEDPTQGYNELLEDRWYAVLPVCKKKGIKVITSMGAANPISAMKRTAEIIRGLHLNPWKVAAVVGDDVLEYVIENKERIEIMETGSTLAEIEGEVVSANAYLGAEPIVEALRKDAHIVITGRVADPSLFLASMIYKFNWRLDDWKVLGAGQAAADMIECGGLVSGGFFADPGYKDVQDLARLGFPLIEVSPNGEAMVTKVEGSGGVVNVPTCTEHMIYEVHDPAHYITPDVVVDFTSVKLEQVGKDRVKISGASGKPAPSSLKVSIGVKEGFIGEGEITYAGLGCVERARLAEQVVRERLKIAKINIEELRVDYIGMNSLHGEASLPPTMPPYEVRLRFAGRTKKRTDAVNLGNEVETLVGKGPCSGCIPRKYVREVLAIYSTLIPRKLVDPQVIIQEVL
jgi:urease gamma subunit